ncbi:hypothetical protein ACFQ46_05015 [Kineococcus sp. GCM10028916]|uniref:hypothetical protein n=1 Tax=Kineococcus sp. GCM10028916 TaxID=3273394 RepID=UPI00363B2576
MADTTAPTLVNSLQSTAAGLGGTADARDVLKLVASESLAAVAAGDSLRLTDADGTTAEVVNGTSSPGNATFALNTAAETVAGTSYPAGTVLTITLAAVPSAVNAGSVAGLQYPATIADQSGTTDVAGNNLSLASGDRSIS